MPLRGEKDLQPEPEDHAWPGATAPVARVYFRRAASETQVKALRQHLTEHASGPFRLGRQSGWTIVDVTTDPDLQSLRQTFPRLIDGWLDLT